MYCCKFLGWHGIQEHIVVYGVCCVRVWLTEVFYSKVLHFPRFERIHLRMICECFFSFHFDERNKKRKRKKLVQRRPAFHSHQPQLKFCFYFHVLLFIIFYKNVCRVQVMHWSTLKANPTPQVNSQYHRRRRYHLMCKIANSRAFRQWQKMLLNDHQTLASQAMVKSHFLSWHNGIFIFSPSNYLKANYHILGA